MAKTVLLAALLSIILRLSFCSHVKVQDFCVTDLTQSGTPSGYPCSVKVSAENFYYHGLATPGKFIPPFRAASTVAFVEQLPGVNGLGISAERIDIAVGGVVSLNTNLGAIKLIFVIKGFVAVGFVSSTSNTLYTKTLYKGDIFVFPPNLLHFMYNVGNTQAVLLGVYNSQNPGVQVTDYALFANNLTAVIVQKLTFLDVMQVKKLKVSLGIRTVI